MSGALVTTQSEHDTAASKTYPASFVGNDVMFAPGERPKYGVLGARGLGMDVVDLGMLESDQPYAFERYIAEVQSLGSGVHNDISRFQAGHAMWSAVML